jgi:hypothetical protein
MAMSSIKFRTNSLFWACQMFETLLCRSNIIRVEATLTTSLSWSLIIVTITFRNVVF